MLISVSVPEGKTLYQVLRERGFLKSAYCGGRGICGKCRVKVEGREELACLLFGPLSGEVELKEKELLGKGERLGDIDVYPERKGYGIAIDLGTTTVEAALFNLESGKFVESVKVLNFQSAFGADVITRIEGARENYKRERELLIETVNFVIGRLNVEVDEAVVVSNPVMQHFLLNLPVSGFERYPFNLRQTEPVNLKGEEIGIKAREVFVPPPVGNFVGSDFLSNVACIEERSYLLIDLGTNAEIGMVDGKPLSTSVPAGPAFEGVGLFSGMRALPGAVSGAWFDGKAIRFKTVGNLEPEGICASGYFDILYLMRMFKALDRDGKIVESPFPVVRSFIRRVNGEPSFVIRESDDFVVAVTQSDIRKFQLAKAAIYGAVSTLVGSNPPETVILSGAMGTGINVRSLLGLKVLPFKPKSTLQPGNLSLKGASRILGDLRERRRVSELKGEFELVELSGSRTFEEKYLEGLEF